MSDENAGDYDEDYSSSAALPSLRVCAMLGAPSSGCLSMCVKPASVPGVETACSLVQGKLALKPDGKDAWTFVLSPDAMFEDLPPFMTADGSSSQPLLLKYGATAACNPAPNARFTLFFDTAGEAERWKQALTEERDNADHIPLDGALREWRLHLKTELMYCAKLQELFYANWHGEMGAEMVSSALSVYRQVRAP